MCDGWYARRDVREQAIVVRGRDRYGHALSLGLALAAAPRRG
jgi:hypothetical protein